MRTWVPGAKSVLYWFQNSGGWSSTSQSLSRVRGEKVRSLERLPSSSARMPAMMPVKGSSPGPPTRAAFMASVLSRRQQVMRSTLPEGKVSPAARAAWLVPTMRRSPHSRTRRSR